MAVSQFTTTPTVERKSRAVDEVAALIGIGRTATYAGTARGAIAANRLSRRVLVPRRAIDGLQAIAEVVAARQEAGGPPTSPHRRWVRGPLPYDMQKYATDARPACDPVSVGSAHFTRQPPESGGVAASSVRT